LEAASERMRSRRVVEVTLVLGVAILIAVCAYVLTRSPPRVLRAGAKPSVLVDSFYGTAGGCQDNETLPAGASAVRLSILAYVGAPIHVAVYSGSHVLTAGSRGPNWTGTSVTVPIVRLSHSVSNATLCFAVAPNSETLFITGSPTTLTAQGLRLSTGQVLAGRISAEYLGAGRGSWWSRALTVARHLGLGRVFSGTWIVLLIVAMVAAVGILAGGLAVRELS
jgi:hypothetical protein